MSSNLALILTSAVVATVVSAIVGGVFTMWNDHLRRNHERQVRENDRLHDREMQGLADKRARRDHRGQRIYTNVHSIVELVIALGDEIQRLRARPQDYVSANAPITKAIDRIKKIRPALMIDPETADLFLRTGKAVDALNAFWIALDSREQARNAKDQRLGDLTKDVSASSEAALKLLDEVVVESRKAVATAEAALE